MQHGTDAQGCVAGGFRVALAMRLASDCTKQTYSWALKAIQSDLNLRGDGMSHTICLWSTHIQAVYYTNNSILYLLRLQQTHNLFSSIINWAKLKGKNSKINQTS